MKKLQFFGSLLPLVIFALGFYLLFFATRLILVLYNLDLFVETSGSLWLFVVGLRIDTIALSALLAVPAIVALLLPKSTLRNYLLIGLLALIGAFLLFMDATTYFFLEEYGVRPNRLFIDYLDSPKEIFAMLVSEFKLALFLIPIVLTVGAFVGIKSVFVANKYAQEYRWWQRLIMLPVVLAVLFLGVRSSVGTSAANLGTSIITDSQLINEIATNSAFTLVHAIDQKRSEIDLAGKFGDMPKKQVLELANPPKKVPNLVPNGKNIVVILWESMGADFIGSLGGLPLSPNFDKLSTEGILFTNLYATGTRTNRGIESVFASWIPLVNESVLKLGLTQEHFWTIGAIDGYKRAFFYGGDSNFDNMRRFLGGNGFEVFEFADMKHKSFVGKWGVCDEDLFASINDFAKAQKEPFVITALTLTSHLPFDYPSGGFEPYNTPDFTAENAAKYADMALGKFFEMAKKENYYQNTIFLIVADHNLKVRGSGIFPPMSKYHIPALIIGGGIEPARIDTLASQIDLAPTVLALAGINAPSFVAGQDLLDPSATPRAMFTGSDRFAYREGEKIVVFTPKPITALIRGDDYEIIADDKELVEKALAHLLLPQILYKERIYSTK